MADAVLDQQFPSGVAPLVILFLILAALVVFVAGCALIYSMPAYQPTDPDLTAGCDRLRAAIREQQQKGEQA